MRILRNGTVIKELQLELPAELHRRLEVEKTRQKRTFSSVVMEWLMPHLQALPPAPGESSAED